MSAKSVAFVARTRPERPHLTLGIISSNLSWNGVRPGSAVPPLARCERDALYRIGFELRRKRNVRLVTASFRTDGADPLGDGLFGKPNSKLRPEEERLTTCIPFPTGSIFFDRCRQYARGARSFRLRCDCSSAARYPVGPFDHLGEVLGSSQGIIVVGDDHEVLMGGLMAYSLPRPNNAKPHDCLVIGALAGSGRGADDFIRVTATAAGTTRSLFGPATPIVSDDPADLVDQVVTIMADSVARKELDATASASRH